MSPTWLIPAKMGSSSEAKARDSEYFVRYAVAMRNVMTGLAMACLLAACGTETTRWEGEGCQPACQIIDTEEGGDADLRVTCLHEDDEATLCVREGNQTPACPGGGTLTCETDDGLPRCDGAAIERPVCGR